MITSRQNRLVKNMRRLRRCKGDEALLEGPHLLHEALDAGVAIETVLMSPRFLSSTAGQRLAQRLEKPPVEIDEDILAGLCDADAPRGVLAVARIPPASWSDLPRVEGGVYVMAESLQDAGNVGALARVSEAAGVRGLVLTTGSASPRHPRALRASAGSLLRIPAVVTDDSNALSRHLEGLAWRCLALAPRGGVPLYEADANGTLVLVVGGEGGGLSPHSLARADTTISVPMAGRVESLNATIAAAIVLFEIRRRREFAAMDRSR
jgi:TrmH family RNA methyltransferase